MEQAKRKVVLQFPDLKTMIDFTLAFDVNNCEQIRTANVLICELSGADISVALLEFKAVIIE